MIVVPKGQRKQGIGSKVLEDITHYADVNGLRTLLTTAVKDDYHGTTSGTSLKSFYKKFGFVENKGRYKDFTTKHNMIREPKKKILKESFETDYKKFIAYHQTSKQNAEKIKRSGFNLKNALQNIVWFTNNKNGIAENSTGASGSGVVLKLEVTINKAADWDLYDDKTLDELESLGYDGVILKEKDGTFDGFVFYPKQLKVLDVISSEDIKESIDEDKIPETIKVNGVERPTKNNFGEYIFDNISDIISFWKWFGNSKIVDSSGRPILATHSTNTKFSEFDKEKTSSGAAWGKGLYFSLDKKWNGGKYTKHCYLKSQHPLNGKKISKEDFKKLSEYVGRDVDYLPILTLEKRGGDLISGLVLAGFDSFIGDGPGNTGLHIVIPNKDQIRIAKDTEE
jgi:hypothetical protein